MREGQSARGRKAPPSHVCLIDEEHKKDLRFKGGLKRQHRVMERPLAWQLAEDSERRYSDAMVRGENFFAHLVTIFARALRCLGWSYFQSFR